MSTLKFHWFLPTNGGDGRQVVGGGHGVEAGASGRPASVPYLGQIARSAEQLGFEAALTPTGAWCEDAWVSTAMLSSLSERLKFLVAFRPGLTSPFLAAQMAGTFQNLSGGRLLLNVVTGGESHEQRMFGDFLDKDDRYARCDEFLDDRARAVDRRDRHLRGRAPARRGRRPRPDPRPAAARSTSAARRRRPVEVAAQARRRLPDLGRAAGGRRREGRVDPQARRRRRAARAVRFGIRLHTIARDTSEAAWAEADRLLAGIADEDDRPGPGGAQAQRVRGPARGCSTSTAARKDDLEIHPNLWAGVGLVRGGAGTAMVGSHAEVADLIEQYVAVGIDEFVLSGYPHLEEAYWFGEGVLPELAARGLWQHPAPHAVGDGAPVPFGVGAGGRVVTRVAVVVGNPKPAEPHARRRDVRRPRAAAASPTSSSTSPTSARAARLGGPERRRPGRARSARPTWSSWPARPTRRTYTGLLKLFLDRFADRPGCAASPSR